MLGDANFHLDPVPRIVEDSRVKISVTPRPPALRDSRAGVPPVPPGVSPAKLRHGPLRKAGATPAPLARARPKTTILDSLSAAFVANLFELWRKSRVFR